MSDSIFHITEGPRKDNKFWPKARGLSLLDFVNLLSRHTAQDNKDSYCIIPGILVGDKRAATDVKQVDALIYDVDGLQTIEEAQACLEKFDTYALLYTSYNHKTTVSAIAGKKYVAWANKNNGQTPPSDEDMRRFLDTDGKEHYLNVKSLGVEHISGGIFFKISHDPIDKFRVVLPLAQPIVLMDLSYNSSEGLDIFKSIYHGVGHTLGLKYDVSCSDPSRVYYLPSCSATNLSKAQVISVNTDYSYNEELGVMEFASEPKLLDFEQFPRKTLSPKKNRSSSGSYTNTFDDQVIDIQGKEIKLKEWSQSNPDFDIEGLLRNVLEEGDIREDRSGKPGFHIKCPFEDNHTKPGGSGTYAVNGDPNNALDDKLRHWNIFCTHDSCRSMVGDSSQRLYHLKELIVQGDVCYQDLYEEAVSSTTNIVTSDATLAVSLGFTEDFVDTSKSIRQSIKERAAQVAREEQELAKAEALKIKGADATYMRDAELESSIVYREVIDDLRSNMSSALIKLFVQRIRRCGHEVSEVEIADDLAKSRINTDSAQRFLDEIKLNFPNFKRKQAAEKFKKLLADRIVSTPLDEDFAELCAARKTGAELEAALQAIADKKLLRYEEAHSLYADYEKGIWESVYSKETADALMRLTDRYAKIKNGSGWTFLDKPSTERLRIPIFSSPQGLYTLYANKSIKVYEQDKKAKVRTCKDVPIMSIWQKESASIREFSGITFAPGALADAPENKDKYNLWDRENPWGCAPKEGDASPILDHILQAWCNDDVTTFNWVCTYLADIFQNPGDKKQTALVLTGRQGTGKSLPLEFGLSIMLGKSYGSSASETDITGKFNSSLAGKLLWVAEEVLFAGNQKAYNVLKDRISRTEIDIENKGMDKYTIPSCTRFIFTSNQTHVVGLDSDDRRLVVLEVSPRYVGRFKYFTELRNWLDNGGREIWLNWLLNFNPSSVGMRFDDLFSAVQTKSKEDQLDMSLVASEQFFYELLTEGQLISLPLSDQKYKIQWPLNESLTVPIVEFKTLFAEFLRHVDSNAYKYERNRGIVLAERFVGIKNLTASTPRKIGGKSVKCIVFARRLACLDKALELKRVKQIDYDNALVCGVGVDIEAQK